MSVLDPTSIAGRTSSNYPEPFRTKLAGREKRPLGDALGLKNFGVNHVRLPPGARSSLRHWHARQDEFVYVIEGTATLVTNAGKMLVPSGHCAGFPAGQADGHCLINETDKDVVYLEIGDRAPGDVVAYPDDDLAAKGTSGWAMTRKDGSPL